MTARILATLALGGSATLGLALAVPGASSAFADPVCAGAIYTGTVAGDGGVGPSCAPYPLATTCVSDTTGLSPTLVVKPYACVPAP